MLKKILSLILTSALMLSMAVLFSGCEDASSSSSDSKTSNKNAKDIKIGAILTGDENENYSLPHIEGINFAVSSLGISENNVIWKYNTPVQSCEDTANDLVNQGCDIIFANNYDYETYIQLVAEKNPEVTFVSISGDFAAICGINNHKNAFTKIYQARYVSGVVAGLKLKELIENDELTKEKLPTAFDKDGNIKIGYVAPFDYSEVVSGYTAFYLGIKSVVKNVVMEVKTTGTWLNADAESSAAELLIDDGCVIISQHSELTAVSALAESKAKEGKMIYSIGYGVDMRDIAPTTSLTSAINNWSAYYKYAIDCILKGEEINADWAEGYSAGAVTTSELGKNVAKGTKKYIDEVVDKIKNESVQVFDIRNFTVDNQAISNAQVDLSYYDFSGSEPTVLYAGETKEAIINGYFSESTLRSAPYFSLKIDGITVSN